MHISIAWPKRVRWFNFIIKWSLEYIILNENANKMGKSWFSFVLHYQSTSLSSIISPEYKNYWNIIIIDIRSLFNTNWTTYFKNLGFSTSFLFPCLFQLQVFLLSTRLVEMLSYPPESRFKLSFISEKKKSIFCSWSSLLFATICILGWNVNFAFHLLPIFRGDT